MQSIPKKIHSYSAYLIFQKVKLKKAKIFVFPFSFYQDHLRMKWSEIFPASVLSRDKAQCHLLTATFWDNHGLNTLLCWWLLVSNESASFSTFRRAPNTCESGFVLFPLRNTWMLRLAWAHGKRNSLLVIQKVGKWLMSWSRQGQGTRTGKRQEEQGKKKKKKQIYAQLPACNRTAQPTRRLRCGCVTAPEALPRAWGKQVSTEGVEQHLKQAERGAPESRSHLSLLST